MRLKEIYIFRWLNTCVHSLRAGLRAFYDTIRFKPTDDNAPIEIQRAKQLIKAIDAGGIPLDPARIVKIAEDLGLEVSRKAKMQDTIERIRQALQRC